MPFFTGTTTPLVGAATWISPTRWRDTQMQINGSVLADQAGTIYIEQTADARAGDPATANTADWEVSTSYLIAANAGKAFQEPLTAPYWRMRFVNGATPQTKLRVAATAQAAAQ